ncbi:MAG: Trp biosynthesis-associated membrane protein [Candidatus Nanopelagicales bacterium]
MNSRTVATLLTIAATAGLYFVARDYPALDVGLGAAACALVATWVLSERALRVSLAVVAAAMWITSMFLAAGSLAVVVPCLLGFAGAVLIATRCQHWPGMSSRFARGGTRDEQREASARELWESLDRGEDPTDGNTDS